MEKVPRLTEVFLLERVEHVSRDRRFAWVSRHDVSGRTDVDPGFKVPAWDTSGLPAGRRAVEDLLERVRLSSFPDAPSRLGCRFVFPDVHQAKAWSKGGGQVFQVEVTGRVLFTDLTLYTRLVEAYGGGHDPGPEAERLARRYWEGVGDARVRGGRGQDVECVVDGTVTVVREITSGQLAAMRDPTGMWGT